MGVLYLGQGPMPEGRMSGGHVMEKLGVKVKGANVWSKERK